MDLAPFKQRPSRIPRLNPISLRGHWPRLCIYLLSIRHALETKGLLGKSGHACCDPPRKERCDYERSHDFACDVCFRRPGRQRLRPRLDLGGDLYEDGQHDDRDHLHPGQPAGLRAGAQPAAVETNYVDPNYGEAINLQANYAPAYAQPAPVQPVYAQPVSAPPAYAQATYTQTNYVQPTYAAYTPVAYAPTYAPISYARPVVRPVVQPVVYAQPAYVARPVAASYVATYPVYRPLVAAYTPTYVASPATCPVPAAQPVVAAGPKVWVHDKVYVQGQPIRNFLTAITP